MDERVYFPYLMDKKMIMMMMPLIVIVAMVMKK